MCGFAGIVSWDDQFCGDLDVLARMSARVSHRGPDGDGWVMLPAEPSDEPCPRVVMAHRRLAILDTDPRANQPFTDLAGRWIVFNGEIYNFRDLREELSSLRPDYAWRTSGDTEVLLLAYDVWGTDCCRRLTGMFAFAIWDCLRGQLMLARDRMGQKPLYLAAAPGWKAIAFASELPAILEVPWVGRTVDAGAVVEYLRRGYVAGGSIYREIDALGPAQVLTLAADPDGAASEPVRTTWFNPNAITTDAVAKGETPAQTTRRLVTDAVRGQLVSDVPLGCFLSGGIDSSIVAAGMRSAVPRDQPVMTFTIGFDDRQYDESLFAAEVANHLGTEHRAFRVKIDAAEDLPKLAAAFGEPFGDSSALPTHYLSQETRQFVKVSLSGDGGDELFGGYDRYRAMRLSSRINSVPLIGQLLELPAWQRLPGNHPKGRITRLKRFLAGLPEPPALRYARYLAIFDEELLGELLRPDFMAAAEAGTVPKLAHDFEKVRRMVERQRLIERGDVESALALDRVSYLPGDLLTKTDRCSMLHALEVRSPFMDHAIVGFAAGLSARQLIKGGPKRLLREAFAKDLPETVFKRRKMGFAVPIGRWFRDPAGKLRTLLRDALLSSDSFASAHFRREVVCMLIESHESGIADHSQRLYALLMLELWWAQHGVSS